jgi:hypothetical protein
MVSPLIGRQFQRKTVKMLFLSRKLVTQSLTKTAAPLTLVNKRLKCGVSHLPPHGAA